jgi:hypothetical protein
VGKPKCKAYVLGRVNILMWNRWPFLGISSWWHRRFIIHGQWEVPVHLSRETYWSEWKSLWMDSIYGYTKCWKLPSWACWQSSKCFMCGTFHFLQYPCTGAGGLFTHSMQAQDVILESKASCLCNLFSWLPSNPEVVLRIAFHCHVFTFSANECVSRVYVYCLFNDTISNHTV